MSAVLPKPQLRGFLAKRIKFHLIGATCTSLGAGLLFKIFYVDRRKKRNAEFHKTYDPEKHFKVMQENGLLESAPL
ncbi:cytochrome c oxidase subunit 6C-like [Fopius arisanus]|uniref:Cytochrome c oxidase subunit 6C-like n=1 Tax=Fopius arisanus TaxID=64838 RepID=A0A9R1TUF6_9HYME|nr:PREDICTED: cytochrome c oxidase subunit 6C-like [Fopius arisanus]